LDVKHPTFLLLFSKNYVILLSSKKEVGAMKTIYEVWNIRHETIAKFLDFDLAKQFIKDHGAQARFWFIVEYKER
jgi:hypothetical protein